MTPSSKLVPVEPTEAMLRAAEDAWWEWESGDLWARMSRAWTAMLSVSPVVPDGREDAWQPIETAPKATIRSGVPVVDLWVESERQEPFRFTNAYHTAEAANPEHCGWWGSGPDWRMLRSYETPTHWRYPPALPVSA